MLFKQIITIDNDENEITLFHMISVQNLDILLPMK